MRFALFGCLEGGIGKPRPSRRSTVRGLMALVLVSGLGFHYVVVRLRREVAARELVAAIPKEAASEAAFERVKALGAEREAAAALAEEIEADRLARGTAAVLRKERPGREMPIGFLRRLGRDAEPAIPALTRTLDLEPTEIYRGEVVVLLGRLADHDDRAYDAVLRSIAAPPMPSVGDPAWASYWAAFALATMKSDANKGAAIPSLIEVADRGIPPAREAAVHALGFLGADSDAAHTAYLKGLRDSVPTNRAEAARTLGAFGPLDGPIPDAIGRLRDDPDESVRLMAREAMLAICRRREQRANPSPPVSQPSDLHRNGLDLRR